MKLLFFTLILFTKTAHGFTLNPNTGKGFKNNEINLHIANTDCSGAGFTTTQYVTLVKQAVNKFWNSVPTSSLRIDVKGVNSGIDITGDTHTSALSKVPANTILAGCNTSADDFDDPSILGSAVMGCTGGNCRAVLILNAHPNSELPNKSNATVEAIIAHEIGHAFGLGHSEFKHNLMYFSISGKFQEWLGQDDIDGVTYLYPLDSEAEILGISALGSCGTVAIKKEKDYEPFLKSLFSGIFFIICLIAIRRSVFKYY
ncbi:MAG: hypothetical protein CME65_14070 [Halobacteriovoraceae bacterium]|nr:hypothetical protein [Halobacteriovoraceae bacterium]|tara:strand:+ start:7408 stop:8181 length:774 start_codon:yes stop_codon:yes gene_type:complete